MNTASAWSQVFSILARLFRTALTSGILCVCLVCIGCATVSYKANPESSNVPPDARVFLMPLDVQLFELTAGGLQQPRADWTAAAETHMHTALKKVLADKKDTLLVYELPTDDPEKMRLNQQLLKLHEVVGATILVHTYFSGFNLPTKKDNFDWTLGSGVQRINARYDADCALFIFVRDSYASAGRKAVMVLGALAGIGVTGGAQSGFASLVNI